MRFVVTKGIILYPSPNLGGCPQPSRQILG
ncbi:uncharacterized protein PGTG_07356 [Puccinia graminis f. sp. tritici CRL 75-36-700-3]|uniref:Uncharacterized protein n=1 Tax=Puccinia graminis f. sp. tritici (strain CRL 75-36-700-3 / race SCCL) TaxID=418459 RepID=E3K9J6_PUCGT|nr:uncharacterized protein PGTG_07356 [Puccinia graminis f. sp. tritici CRL 75-36-700-3]EFP81104.1 hypothetical protein PGTG_07356 [Puccinia graminis f. sp. tritici CRL 75-36-700-3]